MPHHHHHHESSMEHLLGLLKVNVHRGVNLAVRDVRSSDPYVILKMGSHKLKTRVVKKNTNPEWNEELTLSIADPNLPIKVLVYDKDTFTLDDKMGDAEFHIGPYLEAQRMRLGSAPNGTVSGGYSRAARTATRRRGTSCGRTGESSRTCQHGAPAPERRARGGGAADPLGRCPGIQGFGSLEVQCVPRRN